MEEFPNVGEIVRELALRISMVRKVLNTEPACIACASQGVN